MSARSWKANREPKTEKQWTESVPLDENGDPNLLDFGTSVNVNEELRRVIRGEIQEIDKSIVAIGGESKKEETIERQLRQDLIYSRSEMANLNRSAGDLMEQVKAHTSILTGLEDNLRIALIEPSGRVIRGSVVLAERGTSQGTEDGTNARSKHESNRQVIKVFSERIKKITDSIEQISKEVDDLSQQHKTQFDSMAAIQKRIDSERLPTLLEEKKKEVELLARELEDEKEKLQAMKDATHTMRTKGGANAQKIADLTKQLDSNRREHTAKVTELEKELVSVQALVAERQRVQKEKKDQLESIMSQREELKFFTEIAMEIKEQKKIEDEGNLENLELLRLKEELAAKLEESQERLEKSTQDLKSAEESKAKSLEVQKQNDEKHNLIVVPGRVEMSEIAEKKELLAKKIEELQRSIEKNREMEKEQLASKNEMKKSILEEVSALNEEAADAEAKFEELQRSLKLEQEDLEAKVAEQSAELARLEAAVKAEDANREQIQQELESNRKERIDKATKVAAEQSDKEDRLLRIATSGAQKIEKTFTYTRSLGYPDDDKWIR